MGMPIFYLNISIFLLLIASFNKKHDQMKHSFLLPHKFKKTGWILLSAGIIAGIIFKVFPGSTAGFDINVFALLNEDLSHDHLGEMIRNNIADELASILLVAGGLLVSFSKQPDEDEGLADLRLNCLQWAFFINYAILFFTIIFFYDLTFLKVMMYNLFTPLLIFIIRFHYIHYKTSKQ